MTRGNEHFQVKMDRLTCKLYVSIGHSTASTRFFCCCFGSVLALLLNCFVLFCFVGEVARAEGVCEGVRRLRGIGMRDVKLTKHNENKNK